MGATRTIVQHIVSGLVRNRKGAGNVLPEILVSRASNPDSSLQLARTAISTVVYSWKHRRRTDPQKKGAGNVLPEILVPHALNTDSDLKFFRIEMTPAEYSRKQRQRTGPQKKGAGNFLPVTPLQSNTLNTDSAWQLARTEMSPAEHPRNHRQRWSAKEGCGNHTSDSYAFIYVKYR